MQGATSKFACIAAVALLFEVFPVLMAVEKEKALLRVHEKIFSFGWTRDRVLEVSPSGRISLRKNKKAEAMLSAAELRALRDLLASGAIQDLRSSYPDETLTLDYNASMEIEINVLGKSKRIAFPHLGFSGEDNSRIYPAPVQDLVCKIYGLEERVGIHYGQAVSVAPDRSEHDDTWCTSASLQLIAPPAH
jgi:hypothetical protein